jgi:hypothetical protein
MAPTSKYLAQSNKSLRRGKRQKAEEPYRWRGVISALTKSRSPCDDTVLAAKNKCLAKSNKSSDGGKATNERV